MKQYLLLVSIIIILLPHINLRADNVDLSVTILGNPHCNDGIDNDADTFTDYPNDSGCNSLTDENEVNLPSPPPASPPPSPSGGGGGGSVIPNNISAPNAVVFKGSALPGSTLTLLVNGQFDKSVNVDKDGHFEMQSADLVSGTYVFGIWMKAGGRRSTIYAFTVTVTQGITTTVSDILISPTDLLEGKNIVSGDINNDNKINLADFSIMAYWYKRKGFPASVDLNKDGVVDLIDFSIVAYYWTG